jgi:hypothetical protein
VIGLLVGAVTSGQSLIISARINTIISGFQSYHTAINSFKSVYNCLPGDCAFATSVIPNPNGYTIVNGNGDGYISNNDEDVAAWQQLSIAEMIKGNYTGSYSTPKYNPGVNIPASKIPNGGYDFDNSPTYGSQVYALALASTIGSAANYFNGPVITPSYAQKIDIKIDDGNPSLGKIFTLRGANYLLDNTACVDTPVTTTSSTVNYLISDTRITCRVWYNFY